MSQVWSEINKVVNVVNPVSQSSTAAGVITSDIVNLENYKKLTYIVQTGASAANIPTITVYAGATSTGATTAIAYKYRTQVLASDATSASGDVPGTLTTTTGTAGFAITTQKAGGVYIIEVDPSVVLAATTGTSNYDHVKIVLTNSTSTVAAQVYGVLAILSEPRYPQAILQTAID